MADLQKFNDLFSELQLEVASLSKKKTSLEQECSTLSAKQLFLTDTIAETEKQKATALVATREVVTKHQEKVVSLNTEYDTLAKDITALQVDKRLIESEIETLHNASADESIRLTNAINDIKSELVKIEAEKESKQQELTALQQQLQDSHKALAALDEQVPQKAAEVKQAIEALEADELIVTRRHKDIVSKLDDRQDDLEDLEEKIAVAEKTLAEALAKHKSYQEYEVRSDKALQAREQALLEQTREFEQTVAHAKRRGSVLQ